MVLGDRVGGEAGLGEKPGERAQRLRRASRSGSAPARRARTVPRRAAGPLRRPGGPRASGHTLAITAWRGSACGARSAIQASTVRRATAGPSSPSRCSHRGSVCAGRARRAPVATTPHAPTTSQVGLYVVPVLLRHRPPTARSRKVGGSSAVVRSRPSRLKAASTIRSPMTVIHADRLGTDGRPTPRKAARPTMPSRRRRRPAPRGARASASGGRPRRRHPAPVRRRRRPRPRRRPRGTARHSQPDRAERRPTRARGRCRFTARTLLSGRAGRLGSGAVELFANLSLPSEDPAAGAAQRETEAWDGVACADHYFSVGRASRGFPHVWTSLGAMAAVTTRVRLHPRSATTSSARRSSSPRPCSCSSRCRVVGPKRGSAPDGPR